MNTLVNEQILLECKQNVGFCLTNYVDEYTNCISSKLFRLLSIVSSVN